MRKNISTYRIKLNGSYVFLGFLCILYQILGSVFLYMPLLYGVLFCYMYFLLEERQKTFGKLDFRWYFSLFFLFFTDITYDFFLFSSWFAFAIFYYTCADWIKTNFKIGKVIPVILVLCAYIFIFILDIIFSYAADQEFIMPSFGYMISIAFECLFAYVLFRSKF
ncbi:hypothetical protein LMQ51_000632 [Campylobacter coli]|nr:hypothetical protein [Campylobacter coli]EIM1028767.1 hypothetical protein [Campylobacter coli]